MNKKIYSDKINGHSFGLECNLTEANETRAGQNQVMLPE